MAKLTNYVHYGAIVDNLVPQNKYQVIKILLDKLFEFYPDIVLNKDDVLAAVTEREDSQTTGIGAGLAFPHARIENWQGLSVVVGICKDGTDFESVDNIPVKMVFLMISSPDDSYAILKTMAGIARFFRETGENIDSFINQCFAEGGIFAQLNKNNKETEKQITANDIVRPVQNVVSIDTSIEEATQTMHLNHLDVLPVIDEHGRFCGELSCIDIFNYEMPHFFSQLQTVSFVRHIDPFEKYFRIKRDLKVKDFYRKGPKALRADATLLEIVFELTVKNRSTVFVVDGDDRFIGAIDRFCIVDKILFF
ncbi:MAG: PTS sugar transporter subunit IIA [Candidatus Omnitrophica bacterium]|nr:PTS sugar transporter subunit IIA [Candidatus Omnitrophota bacterium]